MAGVEAGPDEQQRASPDGPGSALLGSGLGPHHRYEVRVLGDLPDRLPVALAGMTMHRERLSTVLRGRLVDQSALHGMLARLRSLDLELLEVRRLDEDDPAAC